ncbi:Hypothetical protein CINCED_3A024447 [Cinara cedri]|uniref:Uncharacterized protein n=1 Tax=Cinara cedri TaxID=506608 RepID=A0A5E4MU30_9HEMI|nr:Hypothetical protein CINCED_3A024447 [Cinara cedri]
MKKSITVGRKFTKLSVIFIVFLQVLCVTCKYEGTDQEESYLAEQVVRHREEIARQMFNGKRLDKMSKTLGIVPLEIGDMVPEADGAVEPEEVKRRSEDVEDVESEQYHSSKMTAEKEAYFNES